jgi:hypothetical protein
MASPGCESIPGILTPDNKRRSRDGVAVQSDGVHQEGHPGGSALASPLGKSKKEAVGCRRCRGELSQSRVMVSTKEVIPEAQPLPRHWGNRRRSLDLDVLLPE